ncbi:MAG: ATP-NAD kinase family protein [Candidatus Poseidoniaceae archaeon]|nr:ATP-NAD kinase family protein [Candidatus Poseidoniaceae archaeon]
MRVGIIVNPDAGLGGRLGFKGSDGRAEEARAAGAQDRAGPRMQQCIDKLSQLLNSSLNRQGKEMEFVCWSGRMGSSWIGQIPATIIGESPQSTSAQDTALLVKQLIDSEIDLILYAGGDGTTRDIVKALESIGKSASKTAIVGVPGGVKMHSGCFATTPIAAAEVVLAYHLGDLRTGITEVMDLDEEVYQTGVWKVQMYGEAWTPSSPRYMQGAKEQVERASEEDTIEALAEHIKVLTAENDDLMIVWGSGGTLKRMAQHCGHELTLLGIDIESPATNGDTNRTIHLDLNEQSLLKIIREHKNTDGESKPILLLLSPMGGQGFLIGRGNLQLSPEVLMEIGIDNILGVATPSKLIGLSNVRIDTGDVALDEMFQKKRFIKILQGFRTTRLIRIAE